MPKDHAFSAVMDIRQSSQLSERRRFEATASRSHPMPTSAGHAADQPAIETAGKLLILEDEYLIGQDLAYGPQQEGIDILGPFIRLEDALDAVGKTDGIGAAILDLNIRGQVTFELADKLAARDIPFVFYTGYDSIIVPDRLRSVQRIRKPADWPEIKRALFGPAENRGPTRRVKQISQDSPDLASLLPALRKRAREITPTPEIAELLVEKTLHRAIEEVGDSKAGVPTLDWLLGLIETTGIGDVRHLN